MSHAHESIDGDILRTAALHVLGGPEPRHVGPASVVPHVDEFFPPPFRRCVSSASATSRDVDQ